VATARENRTGNSAIHWGEKRQLALLKGDEHVSAPQLDTIGDFDLVGCGGINAYRSEGGVSFARGLVRRGRHHRHHKPAQPE
jgi:hypothetical protein